MIAPWLLPLAAGVEDFIFPAVVILFLLISVLGQVLSKIRESQQAGDARRRIEAPRPPAPARPQAAPPQQDPLRQEVGDFLRKGQRPADEPVQAEVLEPATEDAGGAAHGRRHPPERERETLHANIGQGLAAAGGLMQGHLHEVFDHHVGTLGDMPGGWAQTPQAREAETAEGQIAFLPTTPAAELAAILANPVTLRQAILFQEILQRPEHRWQ